MITTDKDKNLAPEGQRKYFVLMFTVIFITLILAAYIVITLWLVFYLLLLSLNALEKYAFSASMLNNKCFSKRTSTCINLKYIVHISHSLYRNQTFALISCVLRGDGMVINLNVEKATCES